MHQLLEKSGLDTLIRNNCNKIDSFKSNLTYFHPKRIFHLGIMVMINFQHVKQGR